jgi:hypothetical protein
LNLAYIQEQLRSASGIIVESVLAARTAEPLEEDRKVTQGPPLFQTLKDLNGKWSERKQRILDAENEAKDNVRFLENLRKVIEPLHTENLKAIKDALPSVMNSMKMIYTLSRYYSTASRMTNLFVRLTNLLISRCKAEIYGGEDHQALWEVEPPSVVIEKMKDAQALKTQYTFHYAKTKEKFANAKGLCLSAAVFCSVRFCSVLFLPVLCSHLFPSFISLSPSFPPVSPSLSPSSPLLSPPLLPSSSVSGANFLFDENLIFDTFEKFSRRVDKLIDMFESIQQFKALKGKRIDGMNDLIVAFGTLISNFRNKKHDLLDYNNSIFERDFVEFTMQNSSTFVLCVCSVLFCSVLFCSVLFCSVLFCLLVCVCLPFLSVLVSLSLCSHLTSSLSPLPFSLLFSLSFLSLLPFSQTWRIRFKPSSPPV